MNKSPFAVSLLPPFLPMTVINPIVLGAGLGAFHSRSRLPLAAALRARPSPAARAGSRRGSAPARILTSAHLAQSPEFGLPRASRSCRCPASGACLPRTGAGLVLRRDLPRPRGSGSETSCAASAAHYSSSPRKPSALLYLILMFLL